jgi:phosphopantothenoylcysteine decarboxylase / phosphopantothenate---cysteine ligase
MKSATKKRILITAGPTWVAIDQVRVISNIASGETGFILANEFRKLGASVTLLLGPGYFCGSISGIKVVRFNYFSQLEQLLKKELKKASLAAVIHSAAVSDFEPRKISQQKVSSQRDSWKINLVPTRKLINSFKNNRADLLTVGFKFQPVSSRAGLIAKGRKLLKQADLDLVVANSIRNGVYQAYILDSNSQYGPFLSKREMAICLSRLVQKRL